jgi:hypothetical protein
MKAYVINSTDKTVTEVEYVGDYTEIYKLGGFDNFECVYPGNGDAIYVDGEGLLTCDEDTNWFALDGGQALAGNGVVLGTDEEGESVSPEITLKDLKKRISFGLPMNIPGTLSIVFLEGDGKDNPFETGEMK